MSILTYIIISHTEVQVMFVCQLLTISVFRIFLEFEIPGEELDLGSVIYSKGYVL